MVNKRVNNKIRDNINRVIHNIPLEDISVNIYNPKDNTNNIIWVNPQYLELLTQVYLKVGIILTKL